MAEGEGRRKWRKVLYEDQNVPDNYVDKSFLMEMRKNIYIRSYNYWDVVQQATVLSQQVCAVCCMLVCWWLLDDGCISPYALTLFILPLFMAGFFLFIYLNTGKNVRLAAVCEYTKSSLAVLLLTDFLSPILKTLTKTISTDTIYAMSVFMMLGHLLFHDYRTDATVESRAVSLNMSLFASVCLASRLDTSEHVFAVVILALLLFGLWPILQRTLRCNIAQFQNPFTAFIVVCVFLLLTFIHISASVAFFAVILFVNFICPLLLMSLQSCKNNIYGPWDEAVPTLPESPRTRDKINNEEKKFQ